MATKLPSGNYRAQVFIGYGAEGKRQYISFVAPTGKEADYAALEYSLKSRNKDRSEITVWEMVRGYIESKNNVLSPSTIRTYDGILENSFKDISKVKKKALSNELIQRHFNELAKTLKPKSLRNAFSLLYSAVKFYDSDFILRVTLPDIPPSDIQITTDAQLQELLVAGNDLQMQLAIRIGAYCGLRRGEISALRWDDIDFKSSKFKISKSFVRLKGGKWVEKSPKTKKGYRSIPIPDSLLEYLKSQLPENAGDKYIVGLVPDVITKRFGKIRDSIGLPDIHFHCLRHYYASTLLSLGIPIKYAVDMLGHETDGMINKVYGHLFPEKQDEFAEKVKGHFDRIEAKIS